MEQSNKNNQKKLTTKKINIIGMLSALSFLLYLVDFPLPIFPSFLKVDLTDIPALIGALLFGLPVGIFIELIKNIIHGLLMSSTFGVGEVANFLIGVFYITPVYYIYTKKNNFILGGIAGTIFMTILACILNYFILIPLYAKVFGQSIDFYVDISKKIITSINSYESFIIIGIGGFNIVKGIIISIIGYFILTRIKPIINLFK